MTKSRARKFAELLDGSDNIKSARLSNAQSDMVDDTSPQLGGTLDTNGNPINDAAGVELQHNGSEKLTTESWGVNVKGGFVVDGSGTAVGLNVNGTNTFASGYNYILNASNNGGSRAVMFVNGTTRTADGGANALTLRNDGGKLILGSPSYPLELKGTSITDAPAGMILQVKSFNYSSITTSSFSNSGASNTPLYVDITPKSTTSRMFITVHMFGEFSDTYAVYNTPVALLRGSTLLKNSNGSASGITSFTQSYFAADDDSTPEVCSFQYWDAPATTSSVRYRVTLGPNNNSGTRYFYFNRTVGSSTGLGYERGISNITVMEVAQ